MHILQYIDPEDGVAKSVAFACGTANPQTNINPNGRIYYMDPDTYELLDYEHFHIDLMEAGLRLLCYDILLDLTFVLSKFKASLTTQPD